MATTLQGRAKTIRIPRPPPLADAFAGKGAPPPERGDHAPPFQLPDQDGRIVGPWAVRQSGRPAVLVFGPGTDDPDYVAELRCFAAHGAELERHRALIFAITGESVEGNRALAAQTGLAARFLSDRRYLAHRGYGLRRGKTGAVSIVLDSNRRMLARLEGPANAPQAIQATRILDDVAPAAPVPRLATHPPVLVIPRALSGEDCARLIAHWHKPVRVWEPDPHGGCAAYAAETGDFKLREILYGSVVQMIVRDEAIQALVDAKLMRRLLPAIETAFQTTITHREAYRIACYDAAEDGGLPQHRDNNSEATKDRRFTVSVHLNAGQYSGGQLRFREFGEQLYEVETGTAIVWSASLLHEVLPVTQGRRFMVGTHMSGA
jgi:peroxiredoxin/predicted 2-oxoglutarate/Fe(II)-dependent dioxygenase YbiX